MYSSLCGLECSSYTMGGAESADSNTPVTNILGFFYDDEDGCALTASVNGVRFLIIVGPEILVMTTSGRNDVLEEYLAKLEVLRNYHKNEEQPSYSKGKKAPVPPTEAKG
jgi:hypothetical protein